VQKNEFVEFGEVYLHRTHQAQGVFVCDKHGCLLYEYTIGRYDVSRIEYIRLEYDKLDLEPRYERDSKLDECLSLIAKSVRLLLDNDYSNLNCDIVHQKYLKMLDSMGLITPGGYVDQVQLFNLFKNFYGARILEKLESSVVINNESNWLKSITRRPKHAIHPIRHILFINFLGSNIKDFLDSNFEYHPFGGPKWPCLNPAADHFRQYIVNRCIVTSDYKTRVPVGTFICSCGFIYSRKGPDKVDSDKFKRGRIKQFGSVWEEKLRHYLEDEDCSLRELARRMACDTSTIKKYSEKIRDDVRLIDLCGDNGTISIIEKTTYRDIVSSFILGNPTYTRTEVRKHLKKQYAWLYRHDKEWLFEHLPISQKRTNCNPWSKSRVDWNLRDEEVYSKLESLYSRIITEINAPRITKSFISKMLNNSSNLYKNIEKMPKTRKLLSEIVESVQEHQKRRIIKTYQDLINNHIEIRTWILIRKSGINPKRISTEIKEFINATVNQII
jgi:hypothetical protein